MALLGTVCRFSLRQMSGLVLLLGMVAAPMALASGGTGAGATGDSSEVVTFAIPDVWPWAYVDEGGDAHGSLITIVKRLSELTGIPTEYRLRPLRRALIELHSGEVNFSLLFQSPAQDNRAVNVAQVLTINIVLAALADTDYPLTLDELRGKRVGYIRGTYLGDAFERNSGVDKVPVKVISQAIEMLSLGRISAILASDHAIIRSLQTMGMRSEDLRFSKHVTGQAGVLYMSRKAPRPDVAEKFHEAVDHMVEHDELEQIFFGDSGRPQHDDAGQPTRSNRPTQ